MHGLYVEHGGLRTNVEGRHDGRQKAQGAVGLLWTARSPVLVSARQWAVKAAALVQALGSVRVEAGQCQRPQPAW